MSESVEAIDPYSAPPTKFLRWLQREAAANPRAFGSWRSRAAGESLRDPAALEANLQRTIEIVRGSLTEAEADQREDIEQSFSEYAEKIRDESFPDDIGNRAYHSALTDLVADVRASVDRLGYKVHEDVAFGVLPTGQVNGRACAVPAGGLIVALDDGLFNFVYSLAKAVASLCEVTVTEVGDRSEVNVSWLDNDIARSLQDNEEANLRWLEILFATFFYGYPNQAPMRPMVGDRAQLSTRLTTAVEIFVVAHEFGHPISGRYERDHVSSKCMLSDGVEVDEFETARAEELEADRIGIEILRDYHKNIDLSLDNTRWAVWFWIGCLYVMELIYGGPFKTHPSANNRGRRLLEQLAREDVSAWNSPNLGLDIYNVMGGLWAHNQQRFVEWLRQAENGVTPF